MQGNLRGSLSVCWLFDMIRWPSGSGSLIKQHALRGVAPARICAPGPRFCSPPAPPMQRPSALPKPSLSPLSFVIFVLSCRGGYYGAFCPPARIPRRRRNRGLTPHRESQGGPSARGGHPPWEAPFPGAARGRTEAGLATAALIPGLG